VATKKAPKKAPTAASESARAEALESFLTQMNSEKEGEVRRIDDESSLNLEVIPSNIIGLDVALGVGGLPRGRIVEIFGAPSGGKTTLALHIAAQCQKLGGNVGFIDAEHALTREHTAMMGVDPHTMVTYQPSSGEDAIQMCLDMVTSLAFDIVIIDSVAALTPQAEIDAGIDAQQMALQPRLMSKFMRIIDTPVSESGTLLILLNQVRTNLGAYGSPDAATGGKAIPFYASIRIKVNSTAGQRIKVAGELAPIGQTTTISIVKNKVGPPFRETEYDLIYGKGIDSSASLLQAAQAVGVIARPPKGSTYTDATTGERIAVGEAKAKAALTDDPALAQRLTEAVYYFLANPGQTPGEGVTVTTEDEDVPTKVEEQ
jgi:recombination protein RecA